MKAPGLVDLSSVLGFVYSVCRIKKSLFQNIQTQSDRSHLLLPLAVLAPEGDLALGAFAGLLVEDRARVERGTVQMQRHGHIRVARILDPVQAERVVDVAHAVRGERRPRQFLQLVPAVLLVLRILADVGRGVLVDGGVLGPRVTHLRQFALEHLHEAVRVGVVVDRGGVPFIPAQEHQVELAVAGIDQVASVPEMG